MISTYSSQRAEALISSGPVPTWTNAHTYSVRKEVPFVSSVVCSTILQHPTTISFNSNPCMYWFCLEDFIRIDQQDEIVTIVTMIIQTGAGFF